MSVAALALSFAGGRSLPAGSFPPLARATDTAATQEGVGPFAPPTAPAAPASSDVLFTPRMLIQTDALILSHGPHRDAIDDGVTHPGLYLRRARVGADAASGPWRARIVIEGATQADIASAGPLDPIAGVMGAAAPRATEAFMALAPHKAFWLRGGAMRVPLGLSRQIDEADLRLPERPPFLARTTPDFRMGVAAGGDLGLLQYAFGSYAAAPRFDSDFAHGGVLHVLRLSAEPVGPVGLTPQLRRIDDPWYGWWRFSAGLSAFYAQLPGRDEFGIGGDGQFQWRRLCAVGELLWTRRAGWDRLGFSVEPGVFIVSERIELVGRVDWFNDQIGPSSPLDAWGATLGTTFFSAARHARAQLAYTWRRPFTSIGANDATSAAGWVLARAIFTL